MSAEKASIDFHYKIEHYKEQYDPMDAKIEVDLSFIKVFNGGKRSYRPLVRVVTYYVVIYCVH